MFKVEAVNPSPDKGPNDGDLFKIELSRKELNLLYQALGTHTTLDPEWYGQMFHAMALAIRPPVSEADKKFWQENFRKTF